MATAVAVASRLASDTHNSTENTPSAVHRLQMAIADTECAQALLELAMSIVPAPPSPPYTTESASASMSCDTKTSQPITTTKSLLKREFESDRHQQMTLSDEEVCRMDVVKHIKLDHNYYWTGDERRSQDRKTGEVVLETDQFRTYCESIKQNGSVPTSSENSQDGDTEVPAKVSDKENSHHVSSHAPVDSYTAFTGSFSSFSQSEDANTQQRHRTVSESTKVLPVRTPRQRSNSESKMVSNTWRSKTDKKTILKPKPGRMLEEGEAIKPEQARSGGINAADIEDGASENEEKFHNFHLLMKCLVANEPDEARALDSLEEGHRTLSISSDDTDDGPRSSPEVMKQNQECHDYRCQVCQKTFLKKRYLTKHAFRMHPWLNGEEEPITKSTSEGTCPHCKLAIKPKKDLQRHVTNCCKNMKRPKNQVDLDLVSCQLCGVKMRRQLLVRHLAEEHCVDRIGDYHEKSYPYGISFNKGESSMRIPCEDEPIVMSEGGSCVDFKGDLDESSSKASPSDSSSSWQHVTEFGASTANRDSQEREAPTSQMAASKISLYPHM